MPTTIAWTDETWNPTTGCDQISPGCAHCYAKTLHDRRYKAHLAGKAMLPQYHVPFETVQLQAHRLDAPLHWRRPRMVFVNSVSDLFHERIPDAFIDRVFTTILKTPQHTYQILTKRPERMRDYINGRGQMMALFKGPVRAFDGSDHIAWPPPNVWLVVSAENQRFADERIPILLQTAAAVRGVSLEPLLGFVRLRDHWIGERSARDGTGPALAWSRPWLDWVIVGGESGAGARPCDLAWVRSIVRQCHTAGVAVFVKQLGARAYGPDTHSVLLRDPKGGDPREWPEDVRVREYPEAAQ